MKAIETEYRGVIFRSRLEAKIAMLLDRHGVPWAYEPEAFELPSGAKYLPDFYLPAQDAWIEVKGPHNQRLDKAEEFGAHLLEADELWQADADGADLWPGYLRRVFVVSATGDISVVAFYEGTLNRCPTCRLGFLLDVCGGWMSPCGHLSGKPALHSWAGAQEGFDLTEAQLIWRPAGRGVSA